MTCAAASEIGLADRPPLPIGTLRGDVAAMDAAARGVRVWCGVVLGWRRFGAPIGDATITLHRRPGTIPAGGALRGNIVALDAAARGVEVWFDSSRGWMRCGVPISTSSSPIIVQWGRASAGRRWQLGETPWGLAVADRAWDLGEARFPRGGTA